MALAANGCTNSGHFKGSAHLFHFIDLFEHPYHRVCRDPALLAAIFPLAQTDGLQLDL